MTDIPSSYRKNNIGETLFKIVMERRPSLIMEFGVLAGYSTVCMAMALKKIGAGRIIACDTWDVSSSHFSVPIDDAEKNIERFGVSDIVELRRLDFFEWVESPNDFDLIHIDIHNDGNTIRAAADGLGAQLNDGSVMLFEGGTIERDSHRWMVEEKRLPINAVKKEVGYKVVDERFPGLSMIDRRNGSG